MSKKSPAKLPDFLKKVQRGCQAFVKKSGNVGEDSKKSSMTLPVFSKKVREGYETFRKKSPPTTKHPPIFTTPANPSP
jgi:hypothetical protein